MKNLPKPSFSEKMLILGNKLRNSYEVWFFYFYEKFNAIMFFTLKMIHNNVLYDYAKAECLEKSGSLFTYQNALHQSDCRIL